MLLRGPWVAHLLIVLLAAGATVLSIRAVTGPVVPRGPRAEVAGAVHLGDCESGATATGYIRVTNRGTADLVLDRFGTTCSCAAVQVERGGELRQAVALNVPPGGSVDLVARVAVGGRVGTPQRVFVVFQTNDPEAPERQVEVVVDRIRGGLAARPLAVSFGERPQGTEARERVLLFDNGVAGRRVARVTSSNPERFTAALVDAAADERGHAAAGRLIGVLEVVAPCARAGRLDGHIDLALVGEDRAADRVEVTGAVRPAVSCLPDTVVLPRVVGGAPVYEAVVELASRDGGAVRATCERPPEGFTVRVTPAPGRPDACEVRVACPPPGPRAATSAAVVVSVELAGGAKETVTIRVLTGEGGP